MISQKVGLMGSHKFRIWVILIWFNIDQSTHLCATKLSPFREKKLLIDLKRLRRFDGPKIFSIVYSFISNVKQSIQKVSHDGTAHDISF